MWWGVWQKRSPITFTSGWICEHIGYDGAWIHIILPNASMNKTCMQQQRGTILCLNRGGTQATMTNFFYCLSLFLIIRHHNYFTNYLHYFCNKCTFVLFYDKWWTTCYVKQLQFAVILNIIIIKKLLCFP